MKIAMLARAAVAALVMSMTLPAQAQSLPFSFGLQTPDGFGISIGTGGIAVSTPQQAQRRCLGMSAAITYMYENGYEDVRVYDRDERSILFVTYSRTYGTEMVEFDPCRIKIVDSAPVLNPRRQNTGFGW